MTQTIGKGRWKAQVASYIVWKFSELWSTNGLNRINEHLTVIPRHLGLWCLCAASDIESIIYWNICDFVHAVVVGVLVNRLETGMVLVLDRFYCAIWTVTDQKVPFFVVDILVWGVIIASTAKTTLQHGLQCIILVTLNCRPCCNVHIDISITSTSDIFTVRAMLARY